MVRVGSHKRPMEMAALKRKNEKPKARSIRPVLRGVSSAVVVEVAGVQVAVKPERLAS
jgi:hypothetical protein